MATITTRAEKGLPLTNAEVDENFTNLNDELGTKANSSALSSYLPLVGGVMSGGIQLPSIENRFSSSQSWATRVSAPWANPAHILNMDTTGVAALTFHVANKYANLFGYDENNVLKSNNNTIWHSGNLTPSNYLLGSGGTLSGDLYMGSNWIHMSFGGGDDLRMNSYGAGIDFFNQTQGTWADIRARNAAFETVYDRNDTSYYLNPNGFSQLSSLDANSYLSTPTLYMRGDVNLLNAAQNGYNAVVVRNGGDNWIVYGGTGGVRAPVFYDSNNTSFYVDPDTNSIMSAVYARGQVRATGWWDSYGASANGLGIEIGQTSGRSFVISYNRNATAYGPMSLDATDFAFTGVSGGYAQINTSFRAPIFYDSNDTGYYADPNNLSNFNYIRAAGYVESAGEYYARGNFSVLNTAGTGWDAVISRNGGNWLVLGKESVRAPIFYDSDNTAFYLDPTGSTSLNAAGTLMASGNIVLNYGADRFVEIGSSTNYSYQLKAVGDNFQILEANVTPRLTISYPTGAVTASTDFRAPLFYDSNNTGFYADMAGTSNFNQINLGDSSKFIRGGASGQTILGAGGVNEAYVQVGSSYHSIWNAGNFDPATKAGLSSINTFTAANYFFSNGNPQTSNSPSLQAWTNDPDSGAWMAFHRSSQYAINMGLDSSNVFRIGGWSAGGGLFAMDMSGNLTMQGSNRAPIFYDSNNTNFYVDPASEWWSAYLVGNASFSNQAMVLRSSGIEQHATNGNAEIAINYYGYAGGITQPRDFSAYDGRTALRFRVNGDANYTFASGSMRSPIFYDNDDTSRYVDANGTTVLNSLTVSNRIIGSINGSARTLYSDIAENVGGLQYWNLNNNATLNPSTDYWYGIRMAHGDADTYYSSTLAINFFSDDIRFRRKTNNVDQTWRRLWHNGDSTISATGDFRAPIFYDSDNTGRYIDPAGSSNIYSAYVASQLVVAGDARAPLFYDSDNTGFYIDAAGSSNINGLVSGVITAVSGNDTQLYLNGGGTSWAGIAWTDVDNSDYIFYRGLTSTFSIGGGGSAVANKKLHINGGVTIGSGIGSSGVAANGLYVQTEVSAPIFYDSDNGAYYVDPSSNSVLNKLFLRNSSGVQAKAAETSSFGYSSSYRAVVLGNEYLTTISLGYDPISNASGAFNGGGEGREVMFRNGVNFMTPNSANDSYLYPLTLADGYAASSGSFRAPIFYDNNNTNYFVDPQGGSVFGGAVAFSGGSYVANNGDVYARRDNAATGVYYFADGGSKYLYWNGGAYFFGSAGWVVSSTPFQSTASVRAPVFYDDDNTSYYVSPNNDTELFTVYANNWFRARGSTGFYFQNYSRGIWSPEDAGNSYGTIATHGSGRNDWAGYSIGSRWSFMAQTNEVGVHDNSNGWVWLWNGTSTRFLLGHTEFVNSARAPLFYDSNDTNFYADPAGTSVLNNLTLGGRNMRAFESNSYIEFNVGGDANTYYPVLIQPSTTWFHFANWSISRGYADTAPWDPIGTGAHRGGLTFTWQWSGDSAWGGNDKSYRVIQFAEQYTTMVGGMSLSVNGMIVWLRGGGAAYRLHGPAGMTNSVVVTLGTYTASNTATFPARSWSQASIDSEINARFPIRHSGTGTDLWDGGTRVLSEDRWINNKYFGSNGEMYATAFYDATESAYYLNLNGNSYLYGLTLSGGTYFQPNSWIQFNGAYGLYWPNNNDTHVVANTNSTYGQLGLRGSRGGFGGIFDLYSGVNGFMYDAGGNGGIYRESIGRWYQYHSVENNCTAFGTTGTDSAYGIFVAKGIYSAGRVDGSIFYDNGNTAFYVDPLNGSNLNGAFVTSGGPTMTAGWNRSAMLAATFPVLVFNSASAKYSGIGVDYSSASAGMLFWVNGSSSDISGTGTTALSINTGNYVQAYGSFRAPIFYDSDDTNYYINPAAGSKIRGLLQVEGDHNDTEIRLTALGSTLGSGVSSAMSWWVSEPNMTWNEGGFGFNVTNDGGTPNGFGRLNTSFGQGYHRYTTGGDIHFYCTNASGTRYQVMTMSAGNSVSTTATFYAPIVYDVDNTGYYLDPNSASRTGMINADNLRTQNNIYIDQQYGSSLVGAYSASRYQGVFAMGDAYKLAIDGTTTGTLYGIAWSHPNAGGVATNLNTHGALILENGAFLAAISGSIRSRDDMRSPIFYDSNNTSFYLDAAATGTSLNVAGSIVAAGNVTAYSDIRIKDNIETVDSALHKLAAIRGVTYTRTDLDDKERRYAGVIAQEIEAVLPEAVFDRGDLKSVDYNGTIALLIQAVKELKTELDTLKAQTCH